MPSQRQRAGTASSAGEHLPVAILQGALDAMLDQVESDLSMSAPNGLFDVLDAYFQVCVEPVHVTVLQACREQVGTHGGEVVDRSVTSRMAAWIRLAGSRSGAEVQALSAILLDAVHELAFADGTSPDPDLARREAQALLRSLAAGLEDGPRQV